MNIFLPKDLEKINQEDEAFQDLSDDVSSQRTDQHLASADMVVRIRAPKAEDIKS